MHIKVSKDSFNILLNTRMKNVLFVYKVKKYIGLPLLRTRAIKNMTGFSM